ncbi:MAG: Asp-tRNA(Asn)/Glu-tRNA(Gln) amidotransferase subunit GatC [Candidatus Nealsonbacteria bacterium]|nr:Asp-tRNA(Asn)/Glu-tRNA(Gln) amidotransferase subunit GatC [Candidatus Nealsonbacteria bacterium]
MISKQEVQHIAKLARLSTTEEEEEKFAKELSSILDYVEKLKKADISETEEISQPFKIENIVRKDEERSDKKKLDNQRLVEMAPDTKNGYVKVKSIF